MSADAHEAIWRACEPGAYEYQLEAAFVGACMRGGLRQLGYPCIVSALLGPRPRNWCTSAKLRQAEAGVSHHGLLCLLHTTGQLQNNRASSRQRMPALWRQGPLQPRVRSLGGSPLPRPPWRTRLETAPHSAHNAYTPQVGAGRNAGILHYERNSAQVGPSDLVLVDAGGGQPPALAAVNQRSWTPTASCCTSPALPFCAPTLLRPTF